MFLGRALQALAAFAWRPVLFGPRGMAFRPDGRASPVRRHVRLIVGRRKARVPPAGLSPPTDLRHTVARAPARRDALPRPRPRSTE